MASGTILASSPVRNVARARGTFLDSKKVTLKVQRRGTRGIRLTIISQCASVRA